MSVFSATSKAKLATCDVRLQSIMNEVVKYFDCTILCGHRDEDGQEEAVRTGKSKLHWPNSKHNAIPSLAVDVAPYPVNWKDKAQFARLAGHIERVAFQQGTKIRWGGDFNRNGLTIDETLVDMPHIELDN